MSTNDLGFKTFVLYLIMKSLLFCEQIDKEHNTNIIVDDG